MTVRHAAPAHPAATPLRAPHRRAVPRITLSDSDIPTVDARAAVWEGRGTILTSLLIALLLAGLYVGVLATPVYEATARLRLVIAPGSEALPIEQLSGVTGRKIELETERAAITSGDVLRHVAPQFPETDLEKDLRVQTMPGTLVIEVSGQASTAAGAAAFTNAIVAAYLATQVEAKVAMRQARSATLTAQLQMQTAELDALSAQVANAQTAMMPEARRAAERHQLQALRARATRMERWGSLSARHQDQIAALRAAADRRAHRLAVAQDHAVWAGHLAADRDALIIATDATRSQLQALHARVGTEEPDAQVLSHALPPEHPIAPQKSLIMSMATLAGLMIGAALAVSRGLRRGGLRLPETIESLTGLSVLTEVPETQGRLRRHFDASPKSPFRAAFARLRLAVFASGTRRQVILISGPTPESGKGWVTLGLAQAMGENRRVLVIDADMHRPNLASHLQGVPPAHGLAAHILGLVEEADVLREETDLGFDLVPGEMLDSDPETLIASREFARFLENMRARYDTILLNTPPLLASTDARLLAMHCDATIVCARWDHTRAQDLREALRVIDVAQTPILGAVLTRRAVDPTPKFSGYTRWRDATEDEAPFAAALPDP